MKTLTIANSVLAPRRLIQLLAIALLLVLAPLVHAQVPEQVRSSEGQDIPEITFEKHTLPNGLQLILHVDPKLPVVHVNQWFHVGSKNERPGRTGFAHLFEHMMFDGSKNAPQHYFEYVEKAGANLFTGGVNGTTSNDRTNYFATVPSENLEFLLWLESDRLATHPDAFTVEGFENQRAVVKNERREWLENQPYGRSWLLIDENLFPSGHPYSWSVIGSHEDLSAASLEDVKEFFKTYYSPNNLSLTIAGDFEPAEAKRLVEKYFGGIPAGPALDRPRRWIPQLEGEKVIEVMDRVPQERTFMAWISPPYFDPGDAELTLASLILTDGLSSRLQKSLVYEQQIATDVSSYVDSRVMASSFVIDATVRPDADLERVETIITEEIARLAQEGPSAAEVERARAKRELIFLTGLERIGGFGGKADLLNQYNVFLGDPGMVEEDILRFRRADPEGIRQAVATWLDTRDRVLVRFHPETSGRALDIALDRASAPALGADKPFHAPEVLSATLENGLEILVVERSELPKVDVTFVTRAGSAADPPGKAGVAHLTVTTMDLGTVNRNALEIENALGDLGTSLDGTAVHESSLLSFDVLKRNLAPAFAIFGDLVRNPVFPESEFKREKNMHLDVLAQEGNDPNALAWDRIGNMLLFGRDHPYGRPRRGLPSSVEGITRADLAAFHDTYWRPGGSALVFVGDITLAEAVELGRENLGVWEGSPPEVAIAEPAPMDPRKVYVVDRQGAAQTVVAQILPGPPRKTQDYYPLQVADAVWGGGFGTRLNLNLREDKGYSYGVFSFPTHFSRYGMWMAGGGVQTDKTRESVVEFVAELNDLAGERPITEEELAHAKANRVRGYAQNFEALRDVANQVAELWTAGLPMTEFQRAVEELESADLPLVNATAQKYALPEQARLLLVGDLSKMDRVLELGFGELVVLDVEGRPVVSTETAGVEANE